MKKFKRKFLKLLKKIKTLVSSDDYLFLLKHIINLIKQNIKININQKQYREQKILTPITKCRKGDIFWVDFGYGVGNEFRYEHYCVVLAVEKNNVIVVPFTSNKKRFLNSKMVVDLGIIENLQVSPVHQKNSYALIHSIRSINRTRLIRPRINNKILYLSLKKEKMNLIIENIRKNFF